MTARRGPHKLAVRLALALAIAGLGVAAAPAGAAPPTLLADRLAATAYPRSFHMWGSYDPALTPRYDLLVGYGANRGGAYPPAEIRRRNANAILLMTPGAVIGGRWTHGNLSYGGGIVDFPGADDPALGRIAPFAAAEVMRDASGAEQRCANFARAGVPQHVARIVAHTARAGRLQADGWDGVATDGWSHAIAESWYCGDRLDADRDGRPDGDEELRRGFHRGLERFAGALRRLLPAGAVIGGNGPWYSPQTWRGPTPRGWATRFADHSHVEHVEKWLDEPETFIGLANGWAATRTGRPRIVSAGMAALRDDGSPAPKGVAEAAPATQRSCRWGLTLALMTPAFYHCWPQDGHGAWWWMDELDGGEGVRRRGWLGRPLGPARRLASGVWRRDFQRGVALNNSTGRAVAVALGPGHRRIRGRLAPSVNTGRPAARAVVGPKDGLVVRRVAR